MKGETKEVDTHQNIPAQNGCPTWESMGPGGDLPPFFSPDEDLKRKGFLVKFQDDGPRKETENPFSGKQELWFDVEHEAQVLTWTVSQVSLLMELKRHSPLTGKMFHIQLVPVDEEFKKQRPNYKGRDRYEAKLVSSGPAVEPAVIEEVVPDSRNGSVD